MTKHSLKLALTAGGALVGAGAQAAVVTYDYSNNPVTADDVFFNLTTGATSTGTDTVNAHYEANGGSKGGLTVFHGAQTTGNSVGPLSFLNSVTPGSIVDSSSSFVGGGDTGPGFSGDGTPGYVGLSIVDPNNSANVDYGWAKLSIDTSNGGLATVYGFGYETTANTGITVPNLTPVPEPTNIALAALLTGGVAVLALRRRRLEAAHCQSN